MSLKNCLHSIISNALLIYLGIIRNAAVSKAVRFQGNDLGLLQFRSIAGMYAVAKVGDSSSLEVGDKVFVGGFTLNSINNPANQKNLTPNPSGHHPPQSPRLLREDKEEIFTLRGARNGFIFTTGHVSLMLDKALEGGYQIGYTNDIRKGMSGGSVLDMQGRLVGINGRSFTNVGTGATDYLGIPINTYLTLATSPPATTQPPQSTNNTPTFSFIDEVFALNRPPRNTNTTSTNFVLAKTVITDSTKVVNPNWGVHALTGVTSVAISPDGRTLVSGSGDIKIWNLASGQLIRTLGHSGSIAISPDGRILASGRGDIKIWNLASGQLIRTLTGHSGGVLAISPDGRTLVSGSSDTIKIWRVSN